MHSMRKFDKSEAKILNDPFLEYGYGIVAFFKLLKTLIKAFAIISLIVALP